MVLEMGWREGVGKSILSHATYSGVERTQVQDHTLFACDEHCGLIVATALIVFVLAGLLGGPAAAFDVNSIHALVADRAAHPALTAIAIPVTNAGGAAGMIAVLVIVAGILAFQRRGRAALPTPSLSPVAASAARLLD